MSWYASVSRQRLFHKRVLCEYRLDGSKVTNWKITPSKQLEIKTAKMNAFWWWFCASKLNVKTVIKCLLNVGGIATQKPLSNDTVRNKVFCDIFVQCDEIQACLTIVWATNKALHNNIWLIGDEQLGWL